MNVRFQRNIDAEGENSVGFTYVIEYSGDDLNDAFTNQADPDESLYYDLYSDNFRTAVPSSQLASLLKMAQLIEAAQQAKTVSVGQFTTPEVRVT